MKSSSKQIWYVIGALAVILLVGWALMNRNGATSFFGGNTDTQATTTDSVTGTTRGTGGTTAGGSGFPSGWPSDAPALQAGAKITYTGAIDPKTKVAGPTVVYR